METEDIQLILEDAGFELTDRGSYWSTTAIWRDGDNKTAVQIYKDSGVWRDFVEEPKPAPLKKLLKKIYKSSDYHRVCKNLKFKTLYDVFNNIERKQKIKMEKTYELEILNSLLPHYKFYNKKKISDKILKIYRSGFASTGKMNARYVFPIFKPNNPNKIIGFTGRSFLHDSNKDIAKWKHIGSKRNWIYPAYIPCKSGYPFLDAITNTKTVYLIESVGDSLAMTENSILNHLVTFGTDLSGEKILFLSTLEPEEIIIVSNNDKDKDVNVGKISAIKYFVQLMDFFDLDKISIKLPILNDLSESHEKGKFDVWFQKKVNKRNQKVEILNFLMKERKNPIFNKNLKIENKIEKLRFYLNMDM